MKLTVLTRKYELTDDVKERLQRKLDKLDKFFPKETEAKVSLKEEGNKVRVEVTIRQNGAIFRSEETDKEVYNAIDRVEDILERQIRKNRTRLEKKMHFAKDTFADVAETDVEEELKISKVKKFEISPMTVEEAIMQMNLLSHEFYIFRNYDTGAINVVYKRKGENYGVIEPVD
ncbi:MAG: ribosome-associated translation inhibitor RaiA [Clostridia bacterium]|nr:ribosome-associated translation inhibitor RaiA [Clostridia bacterium]